MGVDAKKKDAAANAILDEIADRAPRSDLLGLAALAEAYAAVIHGGRGDIVAARIGRPRTTRGGTRK